MRARRTDATHRAIADVLRLLGLPFLDTSGAGGGLEDFVVGIPGCTKPNCTSHSPSWILVEAKVRDRRSNGKKEIRFTLAQIKWRRETAGFPRLVVTSAEDALKQLRELLPSTHPTPASSSASS